MKKVSFINLKLRQENFLSKAERKEALGGSGPHYTCYARCEGTGMVAVPACSQADYYCDTGDIACCTCSNSTC